MPIMKTKALKTVAIVLASLSILLLVTFLFLKLNINKLGMRFLKSELDKFSANNPQYSFSVGDFDANSKNEIDFSGLKAMRGEETIISVGKVSFSVGLKDFIKFMASKDSLNISVNLVDTYINADSDFLNLFNISFDRSLTIKDAQILAYIDLTDRFNSIDFKGLTSNGFVSTDVAENSVGNVSSDFSIRVDVSEDKELDFKLDVDNLYFGRLPDDVFFKGTVEGNGVFDGIESTGTINAGIESDDLTLEMTASVGNGVVNIEKMNVGFFEYRVDYEGLIELKNFFPDGSVRISSNNGKTELVNGKFEIDSNRKFNFDLFFPNIKNMNLYGTISRTSKDAFYADTVFKTELTEIPFNLTFLKDKLELILESEPVSFEARLESGSVISGRVQFDSFEYMLGPRFGIDISGILNGSYNLQTGGYDIQLDSFRLYASDLFFFGFDMKSVNNNLSFSNILVGDKNRVTELTGDIKLAADDFINLIKGNTEGLTFTSDLNNDGTPDHFIVSYDGETALVDINIGTEKPFKLQLLFDETSGLMGSIVYNTLSFDADYRDGVVRVYNPDGTVGPIRVKDFNFIYDLSTKIASGDGTIGTTGEIEQGGSFTFSGSIDQLDIRKISLENLSAAGHLHVDVHDAYLGDDFKLKDNYFDAEFKDMSLSVTGDVVNGSISFPDKKFDLSVDKSLLFGFNATGTYGDQLDIYLSNINFPISIVDQFVDIFYLQIAGSSLEGNVLITGNPKDPSFYGMLYTKSIDFDIYWIPDEIITTKSLFITLQDHSIRLEQTPVVGYREADEKLFTGTMHGLIETRNLGVNNAEISFNFPKEKLEFWFPMQIKNSDTFLNIIGDVNGDIGLKYDQDETIIVADLLASEVAITFEMPEGYEHRIFPYISADLHITTGQDFEVAYPNIDDSFISFNTEEGEKLYLHFDSVNNVISTSGKARIKTGRLYYFSNDFVITEGTVSLDRPPFEVISTMKFTVDLKAKIREFDSQGNPVDIYLILDDSEIKNLQPRLESSPVMSENEILQILRHDIVGYGDEVGPANAVSTIASSALYASDALSTIGLMDSLSNFNITHYVKNSLDLDLLSVRLPILQNLVISSVSNNKNVSLASTLLNGTSVFAGKYFSEDLFGRLSAQLRTGSITDSKTSASFLTEDLMLNMELSIDWDNPLGTYSVFVQPHELSVSEILDTIGFSFTKTIRL